MSTLPWDCTHLGYFEQSIIKDRDIIKKSFTLFFDVKEKSYDPEQELKCYYHALNDPSLLLIVEILKTFSLAVQPYHLININKKEYVIFALTLTPCKKSFTWNDVPGHLIEEIKLVILFAKLARFSFSWKVIILTEQHVYLNIACFVYPKKPCHTALLTQLIVKEEKQLLSILLSRFFNEKIAWDYIEHETSLLLFRLRNQCEELQKNYRTDLTYCFVQQFYNNWSEAILLLCD